MKNSTIKNIFKNIILWTKTHPIIIIVILFILFIFKSCQACNQKNTITYITTKNNKTIDSLFNVIMLEQNKMNAFIITTNDTIKNLNEKIENYKNIIIIHKEEKEYIKNINDELIIINKNNNKKEEKL